MIQKVTLCLIWVALWGTLPVLGQGKITKHTHSMHVIDGFTISCPVGNYVNQKVVGSTDLYNQLKSGELKSTSVIEVSYSGFPDEAREAFQAAVDIWASIIISDVPIRIQANWTALAEGTLGSAGATDFIRDFSGAPLRGVWYPIALAEKLAQRELNSVTQREISANFNSSRDDWYFGTDGNAASNQIDFLTVVLHEIGHGLGFIGFANDIGNNQGRIRVEGFPMIFDSFLENNNGERLSNQDLFTDPSTQLLNFFTSNSNLNFGGPLAEAAAGIVRPGLYAPSEFDGGSSIHHLNTPAFQNGANRLMVHALGFGAGTLDPGPITLGIFSDIGWVHTFIKPDSVFGVNPGTDSLEIKAIVVADSLLDTSSVTLHFSLDTFRTEQTVMMLPTGQDNEFSAFIDTIPSTGSVGYYVTASDFTARTYFSPAEATARDIYFFFQVDTEAPDITHAPSVSFLTDESEELLIEAQIVDGIGIDSAYVVFSVNGGSEQNQGLNLIGGRTAFRTTLDLDTLSLAVGDTLRYRIFAVDKGQNPLTAQLPTVDFFQFVISESQVDARATYANDFNGPDAASDFLGNVFTVTTPAGFTDPGLHTPHPYPEAGGGNPDLNIIHQLKIPIVISANRSSQLMQFDEIVLVEPGEDGTSFGDQQFWDFVIVEGSTDGGSTWTPALEGYDSRENTAWFNLYTNSLDSEGRVSSAEGSPSLYRQRIIDLGDTFNAGDTVLFRFRLFSDELAFGWGWAIDNLLIQSELITSNEDEVSLIQDLNLFPSPAHDRVDITWESLQPIREAHIRVVNLQGVPVYQEAVKNLQRENKLELNTEKFPSGFYLLQLEADGIIESKKMIINH